MATLKLDVQAGMDRFACEGEEGRVLELYKAWWERIDRLDEEARAMFKEKQVDAGGRAVSAALAKLRN